MAEIKSNAPCVGQIQIADDVIATIAGTAALEADGVTGGAGIRNYGDIADFLGRKNLSRGVKVSVEGDNVTVELNLMVMSGHKLQEVAADVQKRVKNALETMTGLNVSEVNVSIAGILTPKESQARDEE